MKADLTKRSPIKQPHSYIGKGCFEGFENHYSPDPLVNYKFDNLNVDDDYQIFVMSPKSFETETPRSFKNLQIKDDKIDIEVVGEGEILIDFGAEFPAWLEIDSPDLTGDIRLGISEFKQKTFANCDAQSIDKTIKPVKYGNTYRLELNDELFEGVRFGFIVVDKFDKPFHITDIRLICQTKPLNYEGSFECDNEKLTKTWYMAAYTTKTNLAKDFISSILNDRGDRFSWTGDAYTIQASSLVAFKNYDYIYRNLHYTAGKQKIIESYEMYWVLSVIDYYMYTGDKEGTIQLIPQACKRLDDVYTIFGTDPCLGYYGWDERLGAGWEAHSIKENQNAFKSLCIQVWKEFGQILSSLGYKDLGNKYIGYAKEKTDLLTLNKDWYKEYGLHALCDTVNAEILSKTIAKPLCFDIFRDRVNRLSYSPFNQYFIMQAMSKLNCYNEAISSIIDMYGGMLDYGATTLFEVFRPQWADVLGKNGAAPNCQVGFISLGHSWGAGVVKWLNEEILGIKPIEPGFTKTMIKPHLGSILNNVKGNTPTKYGNICADLDINKGTYNVEIPSGITADIYFPKAEMNIVKIVLDGKDVTNVQDDEEYIILQNVKSGIYKFKIQYEGIRSTYIENEFTYPVNKPTIDRLTSGDWQSKYGKDGYCLFQHSPEDVKKLPDYIESCDIVSFPAVKPSRKVNWLINSDDKRALMLNGSRNLGAYYTYDIQPCTQSMVMDIIAKENKEYTVALYFCDFADKKAKISIDLFDRDTMNLIAPIEVLDDYKNGVYVVYKVSSSIRFRINQIRGIDVPISAVFFDI